MEPADIDDPDFVEFWPVALNGGLETLCRLVERGGPSALGLEPAAWDNILQALEWALFQALTHERITGVPGTFDTLPLIRRVRDLGLAALEGGELSPELLPLACQCLSELQIDLAQGGVSPPR
jgi:hypothetical protein